MSWDDVWGGKIFPQRFGGSLGKAREGRALSLPEDRMNPRTQVITSPDGSRTVLKEGAGFARFVTQPNAPASTKVTTGIYYDYAPWLHYPTESTTPRVNNGYYSLAKHDNIIALWGYSGKTLTRLTKAGSATTTTTIEAQVPQLTSSYSNLSCAISGKRIYVGNVYHGKIKKLTYADAATVNGVEISGSAGKYLNTLTPHTYLTTYGNAGTNVSLGAGKSATGYSILSTTRKNYDYAAGIQLAHTESRGMIYTASDGTRFFISIASNEYAAPPDPHEYGVYVMRAKPSATDPGSGEEVLRRSITITGNYVHRVSANGVFLYNYFHASRVSTWALPSAPTTLALQSNGISAGSAGYGVVYSPKGNRARVYYAKVYGALFSKGNDMRDSSMIGSGLDYHDITVSGGGADTLPTVTASVGFVEPNTSFVGWDEKYPGLSNYNSYGHTVSPYWGDLGDETADDGVYQYAGRIYQIATGELLADYEEKEVVFHFVDEGGNFLIATLAHEHHTTLGNDGGRAFTEVTHRHSLQLGGNEVAVCLVVTRATSDVFTVAGGVATSVDYGEEITTTTFTGGGSVFEVDKRYGIGFKVLSNNVLGVCLGPVGVSVKDLIADSVWYALTPHGIQPLGAPLTLYAIPFVKYTKYPNTTYSALGIWASYNPMTHEITTEYGATWI